MIRRATAQDIPAVAAIYNRIHQAEEEGRYTIGWQRDIYPTAETARTAVAAEDLYVAEQDGQILASARINGEQVPEYALVTWRYPAAPDRILVIHTLTVDPRCAGLGLGAEFVAFYEELGRKLERPYLRLDTNARNENARRFYQRLGYQEVGMVPCTFNGLPGVELVCLEKYLGLGNLEKGESSSIIVSKGQKMSLE